jgi:hypothetical protein
VNSNLPPAPLVLSLESMYLRLMGGRLVLDGGKLVTG